MIRGTPEPSEAKVHVWCFFSRTSTNPKKAFREAAHVENEYCRDQKVNRPGGADLTAEGGSLEGICLALRLGNCLVDLWRVTE